MSHNYTFTGTLPTVLTGLTQGVNAEHLPLEGNPQTPDGGTIVVSPGDDLTTEEEYASPLLQAPPADAPTDVTPDSTENPPTDPPAKAPAKTRK